MHLVLVDGSMAQSPANPKAGQRRFNVNAAFRGATWWRTHENLEVDARRGARSRDRGGLRLFPESGGAGVPHDGGARGGPSRKRGGARGAAARGWRDDLSSGAAGRHAE